MQGFALIDERRDMHIPCTGHQKQPPKRVVFFAVSFGQENSANCADEQFCFKKNNVQFGPSEARFRLFSPPCKNLPNPLAGL